MTQMSQTLNKSGIHILKMNDGGFHSGSVCFSNANIKSTLESTSFVTIVAYDEKFTCQPKMQLYLFYEIQETILKSTAPGDAGFLTQDRTVFLLRFSEPLLTSSLLPRGHVGPTARCPASCVFVSLSSAWTFLRWRQW